MKNPMKLMQIKEMAERAMQNHRKLQPFFGAVQRSLSEGSIIEIKVTAPDGKELCANIRVTAEDMELLREVESLQETNGAV